MAASSLAIVLSTLALTPLSTLGESIYGSTLVGNAQKAAESTLIRRESSDAQLTPKGEIHHGHKHGHKHGHHHAHHHGHHAEHKAKGTNFCDFDFPLADKQDADGYTVCDSAKQHSRIMNQAKCKEAADEAGATVVEAKFSLSGKEDRESHPRGCFASFCDEASGSNYACYFWNGGAEPLVTPAKMTEKCPSCKEVCQRPKYLLGTADTAGCGSAAYASDYEVVDTETDCGTTAACLGDAPGGEFRILKANASFATGCFVDANNANEEGKGKVFYNSHTTTATAVKGQPLCAVKQRVTWETPSAAQITGQLLNSGSATGANHYHNSNATAVNGTSSTLR